MGLKHLIPLLFSFIFTSCIKDIIHEPLAQIEQEPTFYDANGNEVFAVFLGSKNIVYLHQDISALEFYDNPDRRPTSTLTDINTKNQSITIKPVRAEVLLYAYDKSNQKLIFTKHLKVRRTPAPRVKVLVDSQELTNSGRTEILSKSIIDYLIIPDERLLAQAPKSTQYRPGKINIVHGELGIEDRLELIPISTYHWQLVIPENYFSKTENEVVLELRNIEYKNREGIYLALCGLQTYRVILVKSD